MTVPDYRDPRLTEQRNPRTERIDVASSLEIVDLLNAEDATLAGAVRAVRGDLARAIDLVVDAFGRGGRLIYVGAGTSGRLGVLDASECPPTFGTPPDMVVGVIAGGYQALVKSSEGAEDDVNAGMAAIDQARVAPEDEVRGRHSRLIDRRHPCVHIILGAFAALYQRLVTAGDDPHDHIRRCAEGRRAFTGVEHAEPAGGSGADVDEPPAPAECLHHEVDGTGQLGA